MILEHVVLQGCRKTSTVHTIKPFRRCHVHTTPIGQADTSEGPVQLLEATNCAMVEAIARAGTLIDVQVLLKISRAPYPSPKDRAVLHGPEAFISACHCKRCPSGVLTRALKSVNHSLTLTHFRKQLPLRSMAQARACKRAQW